MMRVEEDGATERTLWCGNLSPEVSDEVIYELFLQAGPLESVRRPRDPNGRPKAFAFILFRHECSVPYALELFRGEKLFNRNLNLSGRSRLHHIPVLDTHITEFNERLEDHPRHEREERTPRNDSRRSHDRSEDHLRHEREERTPRNEKRRSYKKSDGNEPTSWAELTALTGKGSILNGHNNRSDLQGRSNQSRDSGMQNIPAGFANYEQLLQMGSQMLPNMGLPGTLPLVGTPLSAGGSMSSMGPMNLMGHASPMALMNPMGLMGNIGMYPSMQGNISGGRHFSPEKERSGYHEDRRNRRDHPYRDKQQESQHDNRRHSDHLNHRRHDRGYSSSRSSHERERRDRRSR